jgi:ribosomal protein L37AE/L43A
MKRMMYCPKCGSINISPLVFYRPSIWKCSDCGYEGVFVIEGNALAERVQQHARKRCNLIDQIEGKLHMNNWDGSTDNWPKTSEDHMKPVATMIEDNEYALQFLAARVIGEYG